MNEKTGLDLLREPFPPHQISKLPKPTKLQSTCPESEKTRCNICNGWHHPKVIHLDYVGHAALTDRLLDADQLWTWEPLALRDGLPAFDETGGLWIRLTVCGHSRIGYGHAADSEYKDIGSREKEVIGDALRNAAMRFGAALELWHKGELHIDEEKPASAKSVAQDVKESLPEEVQRKCGGIADNIRHHLERDEMHKAFEIYTTECKDNEIKIAVWSYLTSKERSAITKYGIEQNG